MKKHYESPELEIKHFILSADVLTVSKGEDVASSGFYVDPDEDELLDP